MIGIYRIKNLINGKSYIGSSTSIKKRWSRHKYDLKHNKHHNLFLQRAWNKHGKKSFVFGIIELCNKNNLDSREEFYINKYNTLDRKYGYNICSNPFGYPKRDDLPEESKIKLFNKRSDLLKERWKNNPEYVKKMTRFGSDNPRYIGDKNPVFICPKCKNKKDRYSKKCRKCSINTGELSHNFGKPLSIETKEKISLSLRGRKISQKSIDKTIERNINNAKRVSIEGIEYRSVRIAGEQLGLTKAQILYRIKKPNYPTYFFLD